MTALDRDRCTGSGVCPLRARTDAKPPRFTATTDKPNSIGLQKYSSAALHQALRAGHKGPISRIRTRRSGSFEIVLKLESAGGPIHGPDHSARARERLAAPGRDRRNDEARWSRRFRAARRRLRPLMSATWAKRRLHLFQLRCWGCDATRRCAWAGHADRSGSRRS